MVRLRPFEKWRKTAFVVAGVLLLGFATFNGLKAFTSVGPPQWVPDLIVVPGIVAGHVGLIGLYAQLRDRSPRLARVSTGVVAFAGTMGVVLFVVGLARHVAPAAERLFFVFYLLTLLPTIVGYVLFGVTTLRTTVPSRAVGLLLLGPPAVWVAMMATAPMSPPPWVTVTFSALQAVAHLAVGVVLPAGPALTDRAESPADPTT